MRHNRYGTWRILYINRQKEMQMRYIVTAQEMKYYDSYTIEKTKIPSLLLMERAALEMTGIVEQRIKKGDEVIVFAGTGNNGGDALAVGRLLAQKGVFVSFYMPGDRNKATEETKKQCEILENLGFSIHGNFPEKEYDIVIDGLFGIGLKREISGIYKEAVEKMNALREKGALVAAVDIPSGVLADSGRVPGCAVRADITVTFGYGKAGHYFYPGRENTGELFIRDIGITQKALEEKSPSYMTFCREELKELLPERKKWGNKGTFGKVLLYAGSREMCGAALLCGRSILRSGAGMLKIITPSENRAVIQQALPEAMLYTYDEMPEEDMVKQSMAWADVLVAGPGIGKGEAAHFLMTMFLKQGKLPMIVDADGLNLIAEEEHLQKAVKEYEKNKLIMTPHPGEFIRLSGQSMEEYQQNPYQSVRKLADEFSCIVVGKDAVTLAAEPFKETVYMNITGNDGMATAGSGDVLAGVIGGLIAQRQEGFQAACLGVGLHGAAGDRAAVKRGRYGMTASDILEEIAEIMRGA